MSLVSPTSSRFDVRVPRPSIPTTIVLSVTFLSYNVWTLSWVFNLLSGPLKTRDLHRDTSGRPFEGVIGNLTTSTEDTKPVPVN